MACHLARKIGTTQIVSPISRTFRGPAFSHGRERLIGQTESPVDYFFVRRLNPGLRVVPRLFSSRTSRIKMVRKRCIPERRSIGAGSSVPDRRP